LPSKKACGPREVLRSSGRCIAANSRETFAFAVEFRARDTKVCQQRGVVKGYEHGKLETRWRLAVSGPRGRDRFLVVRMREQFNNCVVGTRCWIGGARFWLAKASHADHRTTHDGGG
jgi:hypothetical protein